jgi:uncharacterized Zn-binding protein involved in type VI secretion
MPPAIRLGDVTAHGTPLGPGPGSSKVMIGGQPAWRATSDVHQCPLSDGPKPHVGGVITKGSTKVFIGGMPAARAGDIIAEAGPSNSVTVGYQKVQIGG